MESILINEDKIFNSLNKKKLGKSNYVQLLKDKLIKCKRKGLENLTPEYVKNLENKLILSQIQFLIEKDNEQNYYSEMFKNLEITGKSKLNPYEILPDLVYPVENLVGDNFQNMVIKDLEDGRLFESSGTTNPEGRKKIYYDAISLLFSREIHVIEWEYAIDSEITKKDQILLLIPKEAIYGMPFASSVVDFLESRDAKIHYAVSFINPPEIKLDKFYNVQNAKLNFRNNVSPNKGGIIKFNLAKKTSKGNSSLIGLLPNIIGMIQNMENLTGIKKLLGKISVKYVVTGGGLKNQAVPIMIQNKGLEAVSDYLKVISKITEFPIDYLISLYTSEDPIMKSKFDEVYVMYANYILNSKEAKLINVFAAAEIQPAMFSVGSLREIYGDNYYKADPKNETKKDIYYYFPGIIVELMDPITGKIIPRTEINKPGILLVWNPYNISHLQTPKTEDLMQWVEVPKRIKKLPPYMNGIGLQFVSRVPGSKGQGVCA